jgi:hypothetical protein
MSQLKSMIIVLLMLTSALVGCIGTDTTDLEQQITDLEQSKNQMNETIHNMEITLQERNTEIAILNSNVAMLQSLIKNAEAYRDSLLVLLENSNASNDELVLMIEDANYSILSLNSEIIQQNNQIRLWMAGCELRPLSEFINYSNTIPRSYTEMEIQYFSKIAMGSEFGGDGVIHKWNGNVTIQIHGSPSECDREYLDQTISELNRIQDGINLTIVSGDGDINLYFTTYASFELVESNYVFIRDDLADLYKNHLLKEELTQSLGLMNDADWFGDSIFFSYWSSTTDYAEIDKVLISMLYRNDIHSNMNSSEVLEILN